MANTVPFLFEAEYLSYMKKAVEFEHTALINVAKQSYGKEKKIMQRRANVENQLRKYFNELIEKSSNSSKRYGMCICKLTYEQICITIESLVMAYMYQQTTEASDPIKWAQMVEEANPKALQLFDISERRQAKGEINNGD